MRIITVRRIAQVFFLGLFVWLCIVTTLGTAGWQLRGWPVNLFVELDPLAALATLLTTGTLYAGLFWAAATVMLTILFGRFFCGWVCPFGTLHQFIGWIGRHGMTTADMARVNRRHKAQSLKYYILLFMLSAAAGSLLARATQLARGAYRIEAAAVACLLIGAALLSMCGVFPRFGKVLSAALALAGVWTLAGLFVPVEKLLATSLQTGLFDPIPLMQRSINLALLPVLDRVGGLVTPSPRFYAGAWGIGAVFITALSLNLLIPRFYCRFVCPLGALMGVFSRFAVWRIGKTQKACSMCMQCEADCEGACSPATHMHVPECVLCMNCLRRCHDDVISYRTAPSAAGEVSTPDLTRRGFMVSLVSGFATIPMIRLGGILGTNWNPRLIRPPGSLPEEDFLARCIKCGQCMRLCPTNIIQPAGLEAGIEGVWTPTLNFRIGTSGCQLNCVACGQVCPTAAIRPLTLDEKLGREAFAAAGPVRMGTAFVDQGRCLPWSMGRPCIVCQENCPVSPKAIYISEYFSTLRDGIHAVVESDELTLDFGKPSFAPGALASGDYFCAAESADSAPRRIVSNTASAVTIDSVSPWDPPLRKGSRVEIQVRLQRPVVDPALCIGCGICEHECPVSGLRAIRVSAENESRDRSRSFLL